MLNQKPMRFKWAGIIVLALFAAFNLLFVFGEIADDPVSGIMHLLPILLMAILAYLAWKYPRGGGIFLILVGTILVAKFITSMEKWQDELLGSLMFAAPLILGGMLFIAASWEIKKIRL